MDSREPFALYQMRNSASTEEQQGGDNVRSAETPNTRPRRNISEISKFDSIAKGILLVVEQNTV